MYDVWTVGPDGLNDAERRLRDRAKAATTTSVGAPVVPVTASGIEAYALRLGFDELAQLRLATEARNQQTEEGTR